MKNIMINMIEKLTNKLHNNKESHGWLSEETKKGTVVLIMATSWSGRSLKRHLRKNWELNGKRISAEKLMIA